jgi:hypothetical protein
VICIKTPSLVFSSTDCLAGDQEFRRVAGEEEDRSLMAFKRTCSFSPLLLPAFS